MKPILGDAHKWAAISMLLVTAGCSSGGNSNYSQFYQIIKQSMASTFGKVRVTRDQAAAIPYATLAYSLDGSDQTILVLATDTNGELLWTSSTHVVIVTRDGRIVRTVGLGHDLAAFTSAGPQLQSPAEAVRGPFASSRQEDFPDLGFYGVSLKCRTHLLGRRNILIMGQRVETNQVDEACQSQNPQWHFIDSFWIDPVTNLVWQSRQHVNPKLGSIEIQILRPPG